MTPLERRCLLLLRAYPASYRHDRGEEILGTLLEATPEGRAWPLARDIRCLVTGGLRARAALNRQRTTAANLRIAVVAGAAAYLAFSTAFEVKFAVLTLAAPAERGLPDGWHLLLAAALVGLAVALVWVGSRRTVVLTGLTAAAIAVSLAGWVPRAFHWPISELACMVVLALLAGRGGRPGRAWLWLVAIVAVLPLATDLTPTFWSFPPAAWLVAMGIASLPWSVIDARPVIATAVFLLAFTLPSAMEDAGPPPGVLVLAVVGAVAAVAVWPLHRQSARAARHGSSS